MSSSRDLGPLWHLIRVMSSHDLTNKKTILKTNTMKKTKTMTKAFREHPERAVLDTCDLRLNTWDTDYISDNWEPEFMTIFVIWQWIVTLDSIRNSCDVWVYNLNQISDWNQFEIILAEKDYTSYGFNTIRCASGNVFGWVFASFLEISLTWFLDFFGLLNEKSQRWWYNW